jgi:lysophospholipase L1-like esterase
VTTVRLALFGDAVAAGRGAARRTDTLAAQLSHRLREEGHTVTTRVLAAPGARSADLLAQVEQCGRWRPHVAVMVIGANDLMHHTNASRAARQLADAVRRLRDLGAEVVVAPAPDLSALPDTPIGLRPVLSAASMLLRDCQIVAARAAGASVADHDHATSRLFAADRTLFAADRFHPSSAGYSVIAEALFPMVARAVAIREARVDATGSRRAEATA